MNKTAPTFRERAATLTRLYNGDPIIRAVNFHSTSRTKATQYDLELRHYSEYFSSVTEDELDAYITTGRWTKPKPGLIVSIYEGYRNGYDVLAPLLEKHGLTGWFFIITDFVKGPVPDQLKYAEAHRIGMKTRDYPDGRYAMTWEQIRDLDRRKHVIASHARSHTRLASLDEHTREQEIFGAQDDFRKYLGHPVRSFSSLTGPAQGEFDATDRLVVAAGYDFVFSNFRIQRIGVKKNSSGRSDRVS